MPAVSAKQARFFRLALAKKKGAKIKTSGAVDRVAKALSKNTIEEFTHEE